MAQILCIIGGLISGVAAGMGMGGGTLLIPVLTLLALVGQHAAQGVNMISFIPTAIAAVIIHFKAGRINIKNSIPIIIGGLAGAIGGALLALNLKAEWLGRIFGMLLLILAVVQFITGEKAKHKKGE